MRSFFEEGELKLLGRLYFGDLLTYPFYFIYAFTVVYFISIGLSLTQIGILLAAQQISKILFEIPTGAIADKYGRKFSVLVGIFLESLITISIFFTKSFYLLLIIFFLWGAVATLASGAQESWIYDLIKKNKKMVHSYYAKRQFFAALGLVLSGFLGAFFVSRLGLGSIWIISGLASFAYVAILSSLKGIYATKKEHKYSIKEIWKQSTKSIKYSTKHSVLFWIFLAGFFMIISVIFSESLAYAPYLKSLGFPDYAFGYFFSALSLVSAIAPLTAKFFKGKKTEVSFLMIATLLGSSILIMIYFVSSYYFAILIISLASLFYSMKYPIERPFMQKFIPTEMRATILSVQSMVYSLAGVIALPIGGVLIDKFGALNVIIISALLGIPSVIAYLMIKEKR